MAPTAPPRAARPPRRGARIGRIALLAAAALLLVPVAATADPVPTDPDVTGGSLAWQSAASVLVSASGSTYLGGPVDGYQYRTSIDHGVTWTVPAPGSSTTVSAEGETLVEFQALALGGLATSAWTPAPVTDGGTVRLDRTGPANVEVTGGSLSWQAPGPVAIGAGNAVDAGSGLQRYEHRSSSDGGATWSAPVAGASVNVSAEGETLVQFRAVDQLGNVSAWTPAHLPGPSAEGTARIDLTDPTPPSVAGGSLTWRSAAAVTFTASGGTDAGGGVAGYQYRTSGNNGLSWGPVQAGASADATLEGKTLVQFRSVDAAGNHSAWAPETPTADSTALIDRTAPTGTTVSGGSSFWDVVAQRTVVATGASDGDSGLAGYEHRSSSDGGQTWTTAAPGATVDVTAEGETLVQYRAVDVAGNASAWAPASPTNGSTVRIDRTAPTDPSATGGSLAWRTADTVTVSATGSTDTGGSAVAGYQFRTSLNGGTTWSSASSGGSAVIGTEGETAVQFRAVDGAGNVSGWAPAVGTASATVRLDRTGPVGIQVTGGSSDWRNVAGITVTASGAADDSSGVVGYEHRTQTGVGAWSAAAAGASVTVTQEGDTAVQFRATDGAGNVSAWTPAGATAGSMARIDRTDPGLPTVSGGSNAWSAAGAVVVSASGAGDGPDGSGVVGYQYRTSLDGGPYGDPRTGASASVSGDGVTTVQFRSLDAAGNTSVWTPAAPDAGSTVKLDHLGPTGTVVTGGSSSWQDVASVTVSASGASDDGSGVAGYEHRTSPDAATWGAPAPGASLDVTGEGATYVQFRAVDAVGNAGSWSPPANSSAGTVLIDRTDPAAPTVTGGSSSWQNADIIPVTGSGATDLGGSGVASLESRVSTDGGATWSAPQPGATRNIFAEAESVVQFRAVDGAGNASAWAPASPTSGSTVRLDRTAPTGTVVAGSSLTWLSQPSIDLTASGAADEASGLAGYQYRASTDGSPWSTVADGAVATVTAEGETSVQFRARDVAGNVSGWNATGVARLDRTPPTTPTATGGSLGWIASPVLAISARGATDPASGVVGYENRTSTDGGATWSTAAPGSTVTVSDEGETLVQFRAVDDAGNVGGWGPAPLTDVATARLDMTAPSAPAVDGGSLAWRSLPSVTVTGSGSTDSGAGIAGYQHRYSPNGGATWGPPAAGQAVVTDEGEVVVQMRTVDAAGNTSPWAPSSPGPASTVRIDRTGPTGVSVSGGSLSWLNAASTDFSASGATDALTAVAGYEHRASTDGGTTWSTPSAGTTLSVTDEGETLVQFRATDTAGNPGTWTPSHAPSAAATGTSRLDRTAPSTPTGLTAGSPTATAPALSWSPVAGASGYRVLRDGAPVGTPGGASFTDSGAPGGTFAYRVVAVDLAANESAPSAPLTVVHMPGADLVPPQTSIDRAPASPTRDPTPTVRFSDDGTGSGFECRLDGATWQPCTSPFTTPRLADGPHTVDVRAHDASGNVDPTPASASFVVDTTAPAAPGTPSAGTPLALSWPAVPGASRYEVGVGGAVLVRTDGPAASVTGLADTTAPPAPGGLAARGAGDDLAVSWTPVADLGTTHLVAVRSVDDAGNPSAWSDPVHMTMTAGMGTYRVSIDGGAPVETASAGARLAGAGAGRAHRVSVVAVDRAGNASAPATLQYAPVGTAASSARVAITAPKYARPGAGVVVRATLRDGATGPVRWSAKGLRIAPGSAATLRFRTSGRQVVTATASAPGGRTLTASAVVVVDGIRPTVSATLAGGSLRVRVSDRGGSGVASAGVRVGSGAWTRVGRALLALPAVHGPVQVRASDRAGNTTSTTLR